MSLPKKDASTARHKDESQVMTSTQLWVAALFFRQLKKLLLTAYADAYTQ
jgi:hypothetical protein